jgi:hypothetical protein
MGSIFYNSTITLAATDAPDSSRGLFIPAIHNNEYPWLGITALPPSFGDYRGQVYVKSPSWGTYGPPLTNVNVGILQSRGWVMQEKYLSARTLHFLRGQMVWECSEFALGQGGFVDSNVIWDLNLRSPLKAFARAFESSYECMWLGEDDEEEAEGEEEADGGESPGVVIDLRRPESRDGTSPIRLDYETDLAVYRFINRAIHQTIYHVWYTAVANYSDRRLTFAFDKLPALAGIASRVHDITKDDYLAGHWRRELERSLFWCAMTESNSGHPGRVKEYRAPSWSWASVNALTGFDFADLTPGAELPTNLEILEANVDVEGKNPFGRVTSGKIVMKATVMRASWETTSGCWIIQGSTAVHGEVETQFDDLKFANLDKTLIGVWKYDDVVHGILPGSKILEHTSLEEVYSRVVPSGYFGAVKSSNREIHGPDADNASTLWKRGTYVPEDLLLIKGPTRRVGESDEACNGGRETEVEVLVVTSAGCSKDEYRRVGVGNLATWESSIESVEILTLV